MFCDIILIWCIALTQQFQKMMTLPSFFTSQNKMSLKPLIFAVKKADLQSKSVGGE